MIRSVSLICLISLIAWGFDSASALAQSEPANKAVLVFSANVEQVLKSKTITSVGEDGFFDQIGMEDEVKEILTNFEKIEVFVASPQGGFDPESVMSTDFLVSIHMKKEDVARKMEDDLAGGFVEAELDGKKVLKAEGPGAPPIFAQRLGKVLNIGSKNYLFADPKSLVGKDLQPLLDNLKARPMKLVANFDGARDFLAEAAKVANENADFMSRQYISLLEQIATLEVYWSLDGEHLFFAKIKGHDEKENGKIKLKMEAAIGLLKGLAELGLAELERESPEQAKMVRTILDGFKVDGNDDATTISLRRPEGYEKMLVEAMADARQARQKVSDLNKMKQIAIAKHNFYDVNRVFPFSEGQMENVSWRVHLLRYMEEGELAKKFDKDKKWSAEQNRELIDKMPDLFRFSNGATISVVLSEEVPRGFADVLDGSSNTIVFIENRNAKMTPWTKPEFVTPAQVQKMVSGLKDGDSLIVAFYDGSVRRISNKTSKETLRKLCNPADGEVLDYEAIK